MNKEIFDSMQKQMNPSPEVRAALREKLAQPAKKRPVPWMKYGAVAACAALVIGAYTVYQIGKPHNLLLYRTVPLHSYVTVDAMSGYSTESTAAIDSLAGGVETGAVEGGDRDMEMTVYDLEEAMLDVGFTEEEVKEYETLGYQMTWAKWWKFVHEQENSEGDNPFNLDELKAFSQKELSVNTGVLPGGAYVGDVPTQEEATSAYDKLATYIRPHPAWYGGAYIDNSGTLVVCLVESEDPGDKSLELKILEWTGNGRVAFTSGKYSLGYLLDLQTKVCDALHEMGLDYGCGTDEEHNRLDLTLSSVTDGALALLAELDPDDDAIYVQVGQRFVATEDLAAEDPAAHHVIPGGAIAEDDENLIADEPWDDGGEHYAAEDGDMARHDILELPQSKQPGMVQSVPEEDSSSMTAAYDPSVGFLSPNS